MALELGLLGSKRLTEYKQACKGTLDLWQLNLKRPSRHHASLVPLVIVFLSFPLVDPVQYKVAKLHIYMLPQSRSLRPHWPVPIAWDLIWRSTISNHIQRFAAIFEDVDYLKSLQKSVSLH